MKLKDLKEEQSKFEQEQELASKSRHPASLRVTGNKAPWTVTAGTHARAQAHARHPNYQADWWQDFHRKVVRGVESGQKHNGTHLVLSKSHGHGVVVNVDHTKRTMHVITMLDHGQTYAKEGDRKVYTEAIEIE